jgi:hypothetical protein
MVLQIQPNALRILSTLPISKNNTVFGFTSFLDSTKLSRDMQLVTYTTNLGSNIETLLSKY